MGPPYFLRLIANDPPDLARGGRVTRGRFGTSGSSRGIARALCGPGQHQRCAGCRSAGVRFGYGRGRNPRAVWAALDEPFRATSHGASSEKMRTIPRR
jgi:hypothetical protein